MAHAIDTTVSATGAALYALTPAWHGLGTTLDHAFTSAEARSQAGLVFQIAKAPMGHFVDGNWQETPGRFVITRSDTGAALGVCQEKWQPLQMEESLGTMDEIFRGEGAEFEAAGSLEDGAKVWLLARLAGDERITDAEGDVLRRYALLTTGNDGLTSTTLMATDTRVVCNNTLNMALAAKTPKARVIHSSNQSQRLKEAAQAFREVNVLTREIADLARRLADIPATEADTVKAIDFTLDHFVGDPLDKTGKPITRRVNRREVDGALLLENIVAEQMICGGNLWGLFNGVTRYTDHALPYRGQNADETRFKALMGGNLDSFKTEFIEAVAGAQILSAIV